VAIDGCCNDDSGDRCNFAAGLDCELGKQGADRSVMGSRAACPQSVVDWNEAERFMKSPIESSHWRGYHRSSARLLRGQKPYLS
jgi:hypothetical protein